jgi:hypothetical protein
MFSPVYLTGRPPLVFLYNLAIEISSITGVRAFPSKLDLRKQSITTSQALLELKSRATSHLACKLKSRASKFSGAGPISPQ